MKLKFVVCLSVVFLFSALSLHAQEEPKVDVFAGYSYLIANPGVRGVDSFHLNGGTANVAYNVNNWLSGVADFGGYTYGNVLKSGSNGTLSTFLFGPRFTYRHFGIPRENSFQKNYPLHSGAPFA